ncbi:MAG: histidine kinase [bacterium]
MFFEQFYALIARAALIMLVFYAVSQVEFFRQIFYPKITWQKRSLVYFCFILFITFSSFGRKPEDIINEVKLQLLPFGLSLFIGLIIINEILSNIEISYEHQEAIQSHRTLEIAGQTLPFLRLGLNQETAKKTAKIILQITDVSAVAITDCKKILAYEGTGADHHHVGESILTKATREVIDTGEIKVIGNKQEIGCPIENCPLSGAVIAPLKSNTEVIGTLKIYQTDLSRITPSKINLAIHLAQLLSIQTELAELEILNQLKTEAELKALRAQINPHFLFNTLNTIASFYRTKPEEARTLLIKFSQFFRKSLKQHENFISLEEELEYIDDYLSFEKARFGKSLVIEKKIDPDTLPYKVPVLILQPLIENSLKHGFDYRDIEKKPDKNIISITTQRGNSEIKITIQDDGVGMPEKDKLNTFDPSRGTGLGINNVYERLKTIYGNEYEPRIESAVDKGTKIILRIPIK